MKQSREKTGKKAQKKPADDCWLFMLTVKAAPGGSGCTDTD